MAMVQFIGQQLHPSLPFVPMSPGSFKDCLHTWLAVLADQRESARIWVKLPSGGAWLEDFQHTCQQIQPTPEVYILSRRSLSPSVEGTVIPMPKESPLYGEYGLIVITQTWAVMVLAQRLSREASPLPVALDPASGDDAASGRSRVQVATTLQPEAIISTLGEMRQWVAQSYQENPHRSDLKGLLTDWPHRFRVSPHLDPMALDALLAHQNRQHAQSRQRIQALRQKAHAAVNLSTQNEALLNTLRLKDGFLNSVGEELRSPLSTIKTALPLLASPALKAPARQRYLDMISNQCDRQSTLINGVLDLLHLEMSVATVTSTPVQLFDIVPGVVSTYQPLAQEKGIRLAYTIPNTLPPVACPESWLRQIVIHLLHNSIKYTAETGEVWVTAGRQGEDWISLTVRDTGIGIPPQDIPRIFNHFYRGRHPQGEEGAGLGLTIVQQLLLYCGGQIRVESQPDRGSQFRILLPIAVEASLPPE